MSSKSLALQLCHWGPIIALSLISIVIFSSTYSSIQLYGLPNVKYIKTINFFTMYTLAGWILFSYYRALGGPGYVPLQWIPKELNVKHLQYCYSCQGYKAPRSHHCRSCGRCVLKMDHHCPWINTCVGHQNHTSFVSFLFFLILGCIYAVLLNAMFLYHLFSYDFIKYERMLPINTYLILSCIMGIAFSVGACLGVSILLYVQIKAIVKNKSQIEDWICDKAESRRRYDKNLKPFVYPYDLGRKSNCLQVIRCSFKPDSDGFKWPVKPECTQYTFTIEQIEQKEDKRKRGVTCNVIKDFNGSRLSTCYNGPLMCICSPCLESTISVNKGDTIVVTRWRKYWVYGDKLINQEELMKGHRVRGWLPRRYVMKTEVKQVNKETEKKEINDVNQSVKKEKVTKRKKK